MKLLLILAFIFILSACGRSAPVEQMDSPTSYTAQPTPSPEPATPPPTPEPTPEPTLAPIRLIPYEPEYIPLIPRWEEGEVFLVEHFLCDFDYLMHTLRLGFPLFGAAYRRFGLDIDAIEAATRHAIINGNPTSPHTFSQILAQHFFRPFGGFGHLYQHWEARLHLVLANIYRDSIDEHGFFIHAYSQAIYEVMRAPAVTRFYGHIAVDIGQYETGMITPNNLQTNILEDGEIAYVNVRFFNHYNIDHDKEIMMNFYEEIAGFDHLIIDLRQNPGGFTDYFFRLFVEPNLTTSLEWHIYEFFPASYNNRIYADALFGDLFEYDPTSVNLHYNATNFVRNRNMPYFNPHDLEILHNVIEWHMKIDPVVSDKVFSGKIWVLIGPNSQSGVESIAIFLKETGFATLVGEPTAGIMEAISAYKLLPNSGILVRYDLGLMTDTYGRSYEEFGVLPHYYASDCALETVLALIQSPIH